MSLIGTCAAGGENRSGFPAFRLMIWIKSSTGALRYGAIVIALPPTIQGDSDMTQSLNASGFSPLKAKWGWLLALGLVLLAFGIIALGNLLVATVASVLGGIAGWALVPRVVLVTSVMTPLMTYVFLPWITRRMSWWLHR